MIGKWFFGKHFYHLDLFISVGEALKASGHWLCGVGMCLHALSQRCHHEDRLTNFNQVVGDTKEFIVGISKPHTRKEVVPLGGLTVDDGLIDRVFSLAITTVKSIPPSCRMAFCHALIAALGKVAATPDSVEACVRLLLLPWHTLRVFRPSNRQEHRSGSMLLFNEINIFDGNLLPFHVEGLGQAGVHYP
ncbi:hypothetical protein R6Q59_025186 [Mikania micrantha]